MSLVQHVLALPFGYWGIVVAAFIVPPLLAGGIASLILWGVTREDRDDRS